VEPEAVVTDAPVELEEPDEVPPAAPLPLAVAAEPLLPDPEVEPLAAVSLLPEEEPLLDDDALLVVLLLLLELPSVPAGVDPEHPAPPAATNRATAKEDGVRRLARDPVRDCRCTNSASIDALRCLGRENVSRNAPGEQSCQMAGRRFHRRDRAAYARSP
jgi:hypothetical protein